MSGAGGVVKRGRGRKGGGRGRRGMKRGRGREGGGREGCEERRQGRNSCTWSRFVAWFVVIQDLMVPFREGREYW